MPGTESSRRGREPLLLLSALALYALAAAAASYPLPLEIDRSLSWGGPDATQHLWVMRWYKTCLLEGRCPWICPDIQLPLGAPLGNFSPLQLQSCIYIVLSSWISNDILCYNIIWLLGFAATGFGTFLLARRVLNDVPSSLFAGLLAVWSTPVRLHGYGHLELVHLGAFPIFLAAWIGFVERPSVRGLVASASAYAILAMSAAYFMVLAIFPAVFFVVDRAVASARRKDERLKDWGKRFAWLTAFALIVSPVLAVLFSSQIWASAHGFLADRPLSEFKAYGAPFWSYFYPAPGNPLADLLPADPYKTSAVFAAGERASYLGIVTLALLNFAVFRRRRMRLEGFFWGLLGLLVVLSLGPRMTIGAHGFDLPDAWLWKVFPPFRLIRVTARFNLFACLIAAVLAGAGLKAALERTRRIAVKTAVLAILTAIAFVDLCPLPHGLMSLPKMPACYAAIVARKPDARLLEIPQAGSGGTVLNAACAYWQTFHRARTSAGYCGAVNSRLDDLATFTSPFFLGRLAETDYLRDPKRERFDIVHDADFLAYAWLYARLHRFDFIVLHRRPGDFDGSPEALARVERLLAPAVWFEDQDAIVYDVSKMPKPKHATILAADGWRTRSGWKDRYSCVVGGKADLAVYNPNAARPVRTTIEAAAAQRPKIVRLIDSNGVALAFWRIDPAEPRTYESPPFSLPEGISRLTLVCDGEDVPRRSREAASETDRKPFSLHVSRLTIAPEVFQARADRPSGRDRSSASASERPKLR